MTLKSTLEYARDTTLISAGLCACYVGAVIALNAVMIPFVGAVNGLERAVGAKGMINGNANKKEYFYKGTTDKVGLGAKGRIYGLGGDGRLYVSLFEENEWIFHPSEIEVVPQLITLIPGIENLQRHMLFTVSETTPVISIDGKVYSQGEQLTSKPKSGDVYTVRQEKEKQFFTLEEMGDLAALNSFYVNTNLPRTGKLQEAYIDEVLKDLNLSGHIWKIKDRGIGPQLIGNVNCAREDLCRGVEKLRRVLDLETLVEGENSSKEHQKLSALLGEEEENTPISYLNLPNQKVLITQGKVYRLTLPETKSQGEIRINDVVYRIGYSFTPTAQLEQEQQKLFCQALKMKTLDTYLTRDRITQIIETEFNNGQKKSTHEERLGSLLVAEEPAPIIEKPAIVVSSSPERSASELSLIHI